MTDTQPITEPAAAPEQTTILQRISTPLFSFSFVLFLSLLASQTFLLPKLTTFTVGDVEVSVDEAIVYERQLRAEVVTLEDKREELVLPYIDDAHDALMRRKRSTPSVLDAKALVQSAMERSVEAAGAAVAIDAVQLDTDTMTVTVRGAVTDPKPSSMATLAAAIDAVKALPDVADLAPPAFVREHTDAGYRSPFRFTFRLQ